MKTFLEPTLGVPVSQLCTENQFSDPMYDFYCSEIKETPRKHRKQWEFCYIISAINEYILSTHQGTFNRSNIKGLGFGVGQEPLPALFAKYGCQIVATDLDLESAIKTGWAREDNLNQHAQQLSDLNNRNICDQDIFNQNVSFQVADMNNISDSLRDFDFTWSSCCFEHLGSIEKGLDFYKNSLKCLKSGGIAVHTTEFNVMSNDKTLDSGNTVLFRRKDIEKLINDLRNEGHWVYEMNFNTGSGEFDKYIDLPPYKSDPHLKLQIGEFVTTSIGIITRKK